ncbi:sodium calcium transporter [Colletotrichum truncatum]|uniref:Sodium calcium transporter n=1 Tax=Colletotrichum truncatum TaxID=5467 RepID=A0ACC3Z2P9_COLTU|nr:sodium calcium transporter [Colletotrichum truncatum]KAF6782672.1 sodium calcium transporter [Colletotrichum truncatum]
MIDGSVVAYNAAVFISTLFLLEAGADKFVDHTAIVARRTGVPDTLIALLTAGAEWEELAVVVSALAQGRAPLALGNIVGSAISNILGAFSLGLLFRRKGEALQYDGSAHIYSALLLAVTTIIIPATYFPRQDLWRVVGIVLIVAFVVYIGSVGWAINRGIVVAPEGSDSDSDSSSDDESDAESASSASSSNRRRRPNGEQQPLLRPSENFARRRRGLAYHIGWLFAGFIAICLSGYVLSTAATNVADALGASEVLFGIVVLAIGTTLPEKFVAVLSGNRGHGGILVANTVGSNIFLLTLCLGIVMVGTDGELGGAGGVELAELAVLWVSTLLFTGTVWTGGRFDRLVGGLMLVGYIAFIVVEFAVLRRPFDA